MIALYQSHELKSFAEKLRFVLTNFAAYNIIIVVRFG